MALCLVSVVAATGYTAYASQRAGRAGRPPLVQQGGLRPAVESVAAAPHVLFRDLAPGESGKVALASLDTPNGPRAVTGLDCVRVHYAGGQGLCLSDHGGLFAPWKAVFFGADYQPRGERTLPGTISRARVSPDGRYGASTVFVSGDSYAVEGFSTRTTIYDMASTGSIGELEQFSVTKDTQPFTSVDFNFWGVTFAPPTNGQSSDSFYATLGTKGHTYLVRGSVSGRRMEVLRDGVECPSLSPDGTRIAFKQRKDPQSRRYEWRPAVLDLATLIDHPLPEDRNLDDQIEWLDNDTVVYGLRGTGGNPAATWAAQADGTGTPRPYLSAGDSPAVVPVTAG